jgi:hypothetical protein
MVNHSHDTLQCGHWNLHKLVDGEWFHIAPTVHTSDCRVLHPGARKTWTLRAFNGEAVDCGRDCHCGGLTQGFLGGGEYAVVAGFGHPADQSAALVELAGPPAELTLTDDATTERQGDRVVVTTDRYGDGDPRVDATLELTRVDAAEERLIVEQVMSTGGLASRGRGLRNTLAALTDDATSVLLRTDENVADAATGYDSTTRRFRLRGQAYEVTKSLDG